MHHSLFIELRSNAAAANKNLLLLKVITRLLKKIFFKKEREVWRKTGAPVDSFAARNKSEVSHLCS